jgi:hypothetical protein
LDHYPGGVERLISRAEGRRQYTIGA